MNYSEEEIIEDLNRCANCPYRNDIEACLCEVDHKYKETILYIIETQKAEIEKKNNIMNLMAEQLTTPINDKKWVIEYYTRLVEEEK